MGKLIDEFMKIINSGTNGSLVKAPQKKVISFLVVIVAIGILLMFLNSMFGVKTGPKTKEVPMVKTDANENQQITRLEDIEKKLSQNMEKVLGQIAGVGKVTAQVNLASSSEYVYAFNNNTSNKTTAEKDVKGASRTITEVTKNGQLVMIKEIQSSKEAPVLIKEIKPEIQGVIVIAEGAADEQTKAEIVQAVETYFHLPAHKVTVLPMESR